MFRCANPRPKNLLKASLGLGLAKLRVLGYFQGVPVFRGVPEFSGVFRSVPGCSGVPECPGVFRSVPVFLVLGLGLGLRVRVLVFGLVHAVKTCASQLKVC